jgi:hypothetical protein
MSPASARVSNRSRPSYLQKYADEAERIGDDVASGRGAVGGASPSVGTANVVPAN